MVIMHFSVFVGLSITACSAWTDKIAVLPQTLALEHYLVGCRIYRYYR